AIGEFWRWREGSGGGLGLRGALFDPISELHSLDCQRACSSVHTSLRRAMVDADSSWRGFLAVMSVRGGRDRRPLSAEITCRFRPKSGAGLLRSQSDSRHFFACHRLVLRSGARALLTQAVEAEVAEFLAKQTWRVFADEGHQRFLEVAGRDALQVKDRDQ